jgi:hypothetical protein
LVVVSIDPRPRVFVVFVRRVPIDAHQGWERHAYGVDVCVADADDAEERENGNSPLTGLRLFPLDLVFPPDAGLVCTDTDTGAGDEDTLRIVPGDMGIPRGVGGVRVLTYVGVGVGKEAYRLGDTGNVTACVESVEGEGEV